MNFKHIARVYLNWFEQEAHALHVPVCDTAGSIIWSDDGPFVLGYTGVRGFCSYQGFVQSLARSRLDHAHADRVMVEAVALVKAASTP